MTGSWRGGRRMEREGGREDGEGRGEGGWRMDGEPQRVEGERRVGRSL